MIVQIQTFSAFLVLVGVVATAFFVVSIYIKTARDQADASNRNWASAVDALKEHNDALREVQADMERRQTAKEAELAELKLLVLSKDTEISKLERAEKAWTRRNDYLYGLVIDYRERLLKLGVEVAAPNGSG